MKLKYLKIQLLITITALLLTVSAFAANYSYDQNYGTIDRWFAWPDGRVFIKLVSGVTAMNPTKGYYYIPVQSASCKNCNEMREIVRLAAEKRWIVQAYTSSTLDADGYAKVKYLVIDYAAGAQLPGPINP